MTRRQQVQTALLLVLVAFPFVPGSGEYLGNAAQAAVFTIVAASLVMLTGWVGQISLAHAAFVGIGAYATGWAATTFDLVFPLSLPFAMIASAAVAALLGVVALRVRGLYLAVATLIFSWAASEYLFRQRWVTDHGNTPRQAIGDPDGLLYIDLSSRFVFYYVAWAVAVAILYGLVNLRDSKTGRAFYAVRGSEMASASLGMDVLRYKTLAFALSGAIAGVAGSLTMSHARVVSADAFNFAQSLFYLAIAVVGGLTSLAGAVAAGFLFATLEELFWRVVLLNEFLQLTGAVLLAAIFRAYPGGLAAIGRSLTARSKQVWERARTLPSTAGAAASTRLRAAAEWPPADGQTSANGPAPASVERFEGEPATTVERLLGADDTQELAEGVEAGAVARALASMGKGASKPLRAAAWPFRAAVAVLSRALLRAGQTAGGAATSLSGRGSTLTEAPLELEVTPVPLDGDASGDVGALAPSDPAAMSGNGKAAAGDGEEAPDRSPFIALTRPVPPFDPERRHEHPALIEAQHITVRFGGLTAVNDASLEVREGEITALIGPNGAGKTTLFNSIAGFNEPTEGRVRLYGQDATHMAVHTRAKLGVARTFQLIQLFPELTVFENLLAATHLQNPTGFVHHLGVTPRSMYAEAAARERARKALDLIDLGEVADQTVADLPFGVLRMVEVARSLVMGARLIMLDEPASGLDERETDLLIDVLRFVRSLGATLLLIEHDVRMVVAVSDYIYVIDRGNIIATGTPAEIQHNPDVVAAYLGATTETAEVS